MKSTRLSPSSLFIICLSLFNIVVPTLSLKLYEIVCKEALQDESICLHYMQGDYKIVAATTYHELSNHILNLAIFEAVSAQEFIRALARQIPTNDALKQCGNDFYNKIYYAFRSASVEFNKDPQSAKNDAKIAGDGAASCEKAIQVKGKYDPVVHARNNEIFVLSEIAFLALNHLT
jgi:pectinesterase inhibitor-like protein